MENLSRKTILANSMWVRVKIVPHETMKYKANDNACYSQKVLHVYTIEMKGKRHETSYESVLISVCLNQACVIDTFVYVRVWRCSKVNTGPRKRTRPVGSALYLCRLYLGAKIMGEGWWTYERNEVKREGEEEEKEEPSKKRNRERVKEKYREKREKREKGKRKVESLRNREWEREDSNRE